MRGGIRSFLLGGAVGAVVGYLASRQRPLKSAGRVPGGQYETVPAGAATRTEGTVVQAPEQESPLGGASAPAISEEPAPAEQAGIGTLLAEPTAEADRSAAVAEVPTEVAAERGEEDEVGAETIAEVAEEEQWLWEAGEAGADFEEIEEETAVFTEVDLTDIGFVDLGALEATEEAVEPDVTVEGAAQQAEPGEPVVETEPALETEVGVGVAPAEASEEPGAATPAETTAGPIEDLKTRIEETRRRIRRELEEPFGSADEVAVVGPGGSKEAFSPVLPADQAGERGLAEPEPASTGAEPGTEPAGPGLESGERPDYESIRTRIEVTRSRLKAKAFDAMMMGESALLSRESEDTPYKQPQMPIVDSEIDESVEAGLREQED